MKKLLFCIVLFLGVLVSASADKYWFAELEYKTGTNIFDYRSYHGVTGPFLENDFSKREILRKLEAYHGSTGNWSDLSILEVYGPFSTREEAKNRQRAVGSDIKAFEGKNGANFVITPPAWEGQAQAYNP